MSDLIRSFNRDFDAITLLHGERTAFVALAPQERSVTYGELGVLIDRTLQWLSDLGVPPGSCIGAMLPNSLDMMVLFLACLRGGYDFAPLSCDSTRPEVVRWAGLVRPAACVHWGLLLEDVVAGLDGAGVRRVPIEAAGHLGHLPETGSAAHASGSRLFLYTSGTTGSAKTIAIDGDRLWSAGYHFVRAHGADFDRRFCIWNYLPHSYLGGLFNMGLIPISVAGVSVIDEPFSGQTFLRFWQTVERFDINVLWFVPTIVRGMLAVGKRSKRSDLSAYGKKVDLAFLGTAPIGLEAKRDFEAMFGLTLRENFALSETTFITSEFPGDDALRSEGSVGRPLPYVRVRLDDIEGADDPRYREICVHTPFLAEGYVESEGAIVLETRDGFFPTGDVGYLDEAGQLVVTGRIRDIIKKGGHMVGLREIELLSLTHAAVADAAAVPVAHPFYGESYKLCVKLREGEPAERLSDVRAFVFDSLARHKWPDDVEAVTDFPSTASGKIRKFMLNQGQV